MAESDRHSRNEKERCVLSDNWQWADPFLSNISITSNPNNEPVTIHGSSEHLRCIGVGTDAAVFQSKAVPSYAFKKFAGDKGHKIKIEQKVYELLGESPYFSTCFGSADDYLVLSFEKGVTLYDSLLQGIPIPNQVIQDVDNARDHARKKGLNPRDIHLKNILNQNGRAKIIDVSEYVMPGNDYRWEHLKQAYQSYYPMIEGKPIPHSLVEKIRKWYNRTGGKTPELLKKLDFADKVLPF